jgi:two-component system phosphate regulon sensor histidine kinase PhoR
MNRLTEDLLALAGVESPDYKLSPQPIRASSLVEDAIESLAGMVVDSGIARIRRRAAGCGAGRSGRHDPGLRQPDRECHEIWQIRRSHSCVYAQALSSGAGESVVEFVVQDFGPGMAYEHLNRIFERFTGSTRPVRATPAGPGWGWRS